MDKPEQNTVREMPQTFNVGATGPTPLLASAQTYRAKVFKSGNSLALRLPKALGLEAGMELNLTDDGVGGYMLTRAEVPRKKIDVSGFWGKARGIKLAPREDFEERPSTIAAREAARKAVGSV